MIIEDARVAKLLAMAMHPTTNANEAHNAAIRAGEILTKNGISINDITVTANSNASSNRRERLPESFAKLREENEALRAEIISRSNELEHISQVMRRQQTDAELHACNLRSRIGILESKLKRLKIEIKNKTRGRQKIDLLDDRSADHREFITFDELQRYVENELKIKFCKSSIGMALEMPMRHLNAWARIGYFPAELLLKLKEHNPENLKPTPRKKWTCSEINTLSMVIFVSRDDLDAAMTMTSLIGRRVSETTVAVRRRKLAKIHS